MSEDIFGKVMDGIFEGISDAAGQVLAEGMAEYERDQKRPCISTLPYKPVPAEKVEAIRSIKTSIFKGGFKKKLMASIESGRTRYAEVLLIARADKVIDSSEDNPGYVNRQYFYKVADLSGRVVRYDVPMLSDECAIELPYNYGNSASETGCADVVDPAGYQHMFLLNYYIGDDECDVLLTKEQFDTFEELVKNAPLGGYYHYLNDGVGYKW